MRSRAVASFWDGYARLPQSIQKAARKQYSRWLLDPRHPSIQFKKVGEYWSARVSGNYRAVGVLDGDTVIWFFIGTHAEYERILS